MSSLEAEFAANALALAQLRAALGDELYNDQMQQLIDDFVFRTASMAVAAPALAQAHKDGAISSAQVAQITQLLLAKTKNINSNSASASSSSSSSAAIAPAAASIALHDEKKIIFNNNNNNNNNNGNEKDSKKNPKILHSSPIGVLAPSAALKDALAMLSVETIQHALALMQNHTDNRALDQLLAPDLVREFEAFAAEKLATLDIVRAPRELHRRVFHLADDNSSILLVPLDNNEVHVYAELETPQQLEARDDAEVVLFVLDISASMNHDERGSYLPPNSVDHHASSISKARALVEPLVLASLRRGVGVSVLPWNFEAMPAIQFRPPPGIDNDDPAAPPFDDVALRAEIRVRCGTDAFRAHGATNIEAALERSLELAREATLRPNAGWTYVTLFLLTDGDETIYLDQNRKPQRVPSDPKHPRFDYFNQVGEGGITEYQRHLCQLMVRGKHELLARRCQLDVHVCDVGEAPTQFLRSMREAVNGHFHALADVARLADEMRAAARVRGGDGELVVIGDAHNGLDIRLSALHDAEVGALCARSTITAADAYRLVSGADTRTAVALRGEVRTVQCVARDELSDEVRETAMRVLTFERRLGAAIDRLRTEQITRKAVQDAMEMISAVRRERDEAVATLARSLRRRSLLQRFLQAVLAGSDTQLAALERLLARYHAPAAAQFDVSAAKRAEMFTERDQRAIAAGLESVRVRIGTLAPSRVERRVERLVAQRGQWARAMLARRCHIERVDGADDTTTLRLRVGAGQQAPNAAPLVELQCSTEALEECLTRFLDPLSFASFLDTIADADTLPSALYVIAADQPPGVLFEQQESLWIKSGGLEVTTLDFFRLFAKLHGRDVDGTPRPVRVPGTFADANFALPLAPDRLTIEVLVQTAAGKLSEPVTGTAMAPLTGVGLFYIAFIVHHLARDTVTGADARRVAELLASLHQWLRHPNTMPKWPDVEALVERLVVRRGIEPAHSCGRGGVPTRAFMYAMLDTTFARAEKFAALVAESRRRSCPTVERADALRLAETLAGGEKERDDADEPPMQLLAVLSELRDGVVRDVRVGAAWAQQLVSGETRANMWRLLYRWCVATTNGAVRVMLEHFARFEPADAFERQLGAGCAAAIPFDRVIHIWLDDADAGAVFVLLDDKVLRVEAATGAVAEPALALDERRVRDDVLRELLAQVSWKGMASAGFGLLKRDWAIVRALQQKDDPAVASEPAAVADLGNAATTPQSALAMVVPQELAGAIQAVRAQHDTAYARWPPHATLVFPFIEEALALNDDVVRRVDVELRRLPPFRVTLADFDVFERSGTLFLTVQTEPRDALLAVYRTLVALFPACLKGGGAQAFNAHVTVARGDDVFALERIAADLRRRRWEPVVFDCCHIALLTRGPDTPFTVAREFALTGVPVSPLDLSRPLSQAQHADYKKALVGRVDVYRRWHRAPAPVVPLPAGVNAAHCVAAVDSASNLSVVMIGDVDSGKSSMSGRLVAELGGLPPHVFAEYERVCRMLERPKALYAFVMDRLREERERQLSIEVHMWAVQALGTTIDLVDCPGHRRFLKNMATGASTADGALLMVSAAPHEFERGIAAGVGMTRTEALVAHACGGVKEFVVAVNKLDLFADDVRRARFEEVCESVARILAACGIDSAHTKYIPVATFDGDNVFVAPSARTPWYQGPSVVEALVQIKAPTRRVDDVPFRMPVLRVHRVAGIGTVVTGRVAQGSVRARDSVVLQPSGVSAAVVSIERFHGNKTQADAGDIVGIALRGIKPDQVERGAVMSAAASPAVGVYRFTARLVVLRTPSERELRPGAEPFLFAHTLAFTARIIETNVPLVKGARAVVLFETARRVVLEPFAIVPALGRFAGALNEALAFVGAVTAVDRAFVPERKARKTAM